MSAVNLNSLNTPVRKIIIWVFLKKLNVMCYLQKSHLIYKDMQWLEIKDEKYIM